MNKKPIKASRKVRAKARSSAKARDRRGKAGSLARIAGQAKHLQPAAVIPGEVILGTGDIVALEGRPIAELTVSNVGDRPIQVGSHCHFFEANSALRFDREKAFGFRLKVPAGTAVRFEPGEEKRVTLVAIGGNRVVYGINGLVNGRLDDPQVKARALKKAADLGFMVKGKGMGA